MEAFWNKRLRNGKSSTQVLKDIVKQQKFQKLLYDKSIASTTVWQMIADEMSNRGVPVPHSTRREAGMECRQKWSYLKKRNLRAKKESAKKARHTTESFQKEDDEITDSEVIVLDTSVLLQDSESYGFNCSPAVSEEVIEEFDVEESDKVIELETLSSELVEVKEEPCDDLLVLLESSMEEVQIDKSREG